MVISANFSFCNLLQIICWYLFWFIWLKFLSYMENWLCLPTDSHVHSYIIKLWCVNINHIMDNPLGINSICHIQIIKRIFTGIKKNTRAEPHERFIRCLYLYYPIWRRLPTHFFKIMVKPQSNIWIMNPISFCYIIYTVDISLFITHRFFINYFIFFHIIPYLLVRQIW